MDITKTSLSKLKQTINTRYGTFYFEEDQYHYNPNEKDTIQEKCRDLTKEIASRHYSETIHAISAKDGTKLYFSNDEWVLIRFSGTEPVLRVYAESHDKSTAIKRIQQTKTLFR